MHLEHLIPFGYAWDSSPLDFHHQIHDFGFKLLGGLNSGQTLGVFALSRYFEEQSSHFWNSEMVSPHSPLCWAGGALGWFFLCWIPHFPALLHPHGLKYCSMAIKICCNLQQLLQWYLGFVVRRVLCSPLLLWFLGVSAPREKAALMDGMFSPQRNCSCFARVCVGFPGEGDWDFMESSQFMKMWIGKNSSPKFHLNIPSQSLKHPPCPGTICPWK